GGGDRRDPARRFGARRGGDQGRRRSRYRHGVHGHAAFPALTLPSAERTASPFGASRGGWTTPLIAAATTSSSRCGFCRQCCCKIWSAPFWTTMAPNKWSSIASELHVRWLQSPADDRFGPIASEIRHRSEMSRRAKNGHWNRPCPINWARQSCSDLPAQQMCCLNHDFQLLGRKLPADRHEAAVGSEPYLVGRQIFKHARNAALH